MGRKLQEKTRWKRLPGIFLLMVYPLVVHARKVYTDMGEYDWFPDGDSRYDFFMWWKSRAFLILAVWMLAVLIADHISRKGCLAEEKKQERQRFLPLFLYGCLAVLSTVCSMDLETSVNGMLEQYENIWVLLGYLLTALYFYRMGRKEEDRECFLFFLWIGVILQCFIGISQLLGNDFWMSAPGRLLITLGYGKELEQTIQTNANSAGTVYMSFYNQNYAGVYVALVFPVLFFLGLQRKQLWKKLLIFMTLVLLALCLAGSGSKSGILTLAFLGIVAAFLLAPGGKRGLALILCAVCLVVFAIGGYEYASGQRLFRAIKNAVKTSKYNLQSISPKKDSVEITYHGHTLELKAFQTEEGISFGVLEGEESLPVCWEEEEGRFHVLHEDIESPTFDAYIEDGKMWIVMYYNNSAWRFRQDENGYTYVNPYGKADEIVDAPAVLKGHEKMLSGRGYIWGRTLVLLKESILIGTGPDTFMLAFPQDDYRMRGNTGWRMLSEIPSKAHNLYLQSGLQTGVVSAVCLLAAWCRYLYQSAEMCIRGKKSKGCAGKDGTLFIRRESWGACCGFFLAVLSYLIMGITNDSVVCTAPLFWAVLGMGMGLADTEKGRAKI